MKQLIYTQENPQLGKIKGVLRIIGKLLYFKFNNSQQANQMIQQMQSKGAVIIMGRKWIKIDMFRDREYVKLGEKEFDVSKLSDDEVEKILFDFYKTQFKKANFEVEGNEK